MLTICFSNTINLLEPDIYPPDTISLAKGFFDSSGIKDIIDISKCEKEFNDFIFNIAITFDQILDNKSSLATIGSILIDISNIQNKCNDSEFGRNDISDYFHKTVRDPQKYLLAVLDNMLSFHIAGKYIELKGNLKENRMYDTGKTLGDIAKYVMNVKFKDNMFLNMENNCEQHYIEFMGSVYNMINGDKPSMSKLLNDASNLINRCK
jgi:hypothetical protein